VSLHPPGGGERSRPPYQVAATYTAPTYKGRGCLGHEPPAFLTLSPGPNAPQPPTAYLILCGHNVHRGTRPSPGCPTALVRLDWGYRPNSSPIHRRALECLSAGAVVLVTPYPRSPAPAALDRGYALFTELRLFTILGSSAQPLSWCRRIFG
jgi:hypothetical protein